ncbi:urease accessory protein UreF [Ciceribacter azotifigens]|uniref:urease accessory protein UreF n=1 Tax=Ciceribacter azotifigens TaxID=2069303 RepID=UPI003A851B20
MRERPAVKGLLRLMAWLSPAFPVGGFAYSGGLEAAIQSGHVSSAETLKDWLLTLLRNGSLRNDAVLLAEAHRAAADDERLLEVAELATALAGSAERHLEISRQGAAFLAAASAWPGSVSAALGDGTAYSVAVGAVAASNGVGLAETAAAFLHAAVSQLVSVAIRLGVLGQSQGVALLSALEEVIAEQTEKAVSSTLEDLGSATLVADLMSLRHETQHSRLFLS